VLLDYYFFDIGSSALCGVDARSLLDIDDAVGEFVLDLSGPFLY